MSSAHGGESEGSPQQHGGQEGQGTPPPGWGEPPSAPPYGPPPGQGYAPMPPAYGGYAPAPPAGWGTPPRPVERPVTVRAGLGALIGSLVLYLVAQVVTFLNFDTVLAEAQAQVAASNTNTQNLPFDEKSFARTVMQVSMGLDVVIGLAFLLFIWFAWKGNQWARIVLWVLGGIFLVFGLAGSAISVGTGVSSPLPYVTALGWFEVLFLAVGIVLLALKPSSEWFRYRKWQRMTGQG